MSYLGHGYRSFYLMKSLMFFFSFPFLLAQNQQGVAIHEIILDVVSHSHTFEHQRYTHKG